MHGEAPSAGNVPCVWSRLSGRLRHFAGPRLGALRVSVTLHWGCWVSADAPVTSPVDLADMDVSMYSDCQCQSALLPTSAPEGPAPLQSNGQATGTRSVRRPSALLVSTISLPSTEPSFRLPAAAYSWLGWGARGLRALGRNKQEGPSDSPSRTPRLLVAWEPWTRSSKRTM